MSTTVYAEVGAATYWSGVVLPSVWVGMASKYAALEALAAAEPGRARALALRSAARAWPGALREAELIGPERCAERRRVARENLRRPACTRERWRDAPSVSVLLWADLHALLADQLAFRRVGGGDVTAFIADLPPPARRRWPDAETLAGLGTRRPSSRQAYLWLAACAGLSLPALNLLLFERSGHWDQRPDDPEWTQIG